VSAWLKRFGLHMAAAIGATGIFVAAAAVGANQTRQQGTAVATQQALTATSAAAPGARRKPSVVITPTPSSTGEAIPTRPVPAPAQPGPTQVPAGSVEAQPGPAEAVPDQAKPPEPTPRPNPPRRSPTPVPASGTTPTPEKVAPERSLAGTVQDVLPDGLDVLGVGGREWHIVPAAGALIRLNGKAAGLDALRVGDSVVILGQAQARQGPLNRFLAHAITARRK
jgi:hypothetical protein